MTKERISVIGSGLMGHGIAQIFATCGHEVCMYDINQPLLDNAMGKITDNLAAFASRGIITAEEAAAAPGRISCTVKLEETAQADVVIEAVLENMALKQDIFSKLDQMCKPEAILASNTSVMSITEIASTSKRKERILGAHFWNPPHLIPLVEVIQTKDTSLGNINKIMELLRRVGKHPVHCRKDVPGFIGNRMQHALWREALYIVQEGIADAATVDETVRLSFGMRSPHLGPLENADLVGLDLVNAIESYLLPHLCDSHTPLRIVTDRVAANELGFKSGKGLQAWTAEESAASHRSLRDYLMGLAEQRAKK